jgi:hypothetical protein
MEKEWEPLLEVVALLKRVLKIGLNLILQQARQAL